MEVTTIYALIDPRDGAIRYVGKTSAALAKRVRQHVFDARRGRTNIWRFSWIKSLDSLGLAPSIAILATTTGDWRPAEKFWIASARAFGFDLCNGTDGGDGIFGFKHSDETRARMAESAKRLYEDPREREKRGASIRVALATPESKRRLSQALKEAFSKPEVKQRLSAAQKLACSTDEARQKRSAVHKGKVLSEETRRKISESRMGQRPDPEVVRRRAEKMMGRRHSEETKQKMRDAALRRARPAEHDELWLEAARS